VGIASSHGFFKTAITLSLIKIFSDLEKINSTPTLIVIVEVYAALHYSSFSLVKIAVESP